jgi:hypothetical protein
VGFFRLANLIEAGFWAVVAVGFVVGAMRSEGMIRRRCWVGAVTFLVFGVSDVIEAETRAWYRPIGLLVLKGLCLLVMGWLLVGYVKKDRRGSEPAPVSESGKLDGRPE